VQFSLQYTAAVRDHHVRPFVLRVDGRLQEIDLLLRGNTVLGGIHGVGTHQHCIRLEARGQLVVSSHVHFEAVNPAVQADLVMDDDLWHHTDRIGMVVFEMYVLSQTDQPLQRAIDDVCRAPEYYLLGKRGIEHEM